MGSFRLSDWLFFGVLLLTAIVGFLTKFYFFSVLAGGILLAIGIFYALFKSNSLEKVIERNAETNKGKYYMRKYPQVDDQKFRSSFLLAGLLISLGFATSAFNWKLIEEEKNVQYVFDEIELVEEIPPPSVQKPPPPPPPPPPPKLEIVEDTEILEEEPEILELEEEPPPPPPEEPPPPVQTEVKVLEPPPAPPPPPPPPPPPEKVIDDVVEDIPEPVEEPQPVIEEEPEPEEPEIFKIVEEMPEFPGGQKKLFKYLKKNIKYPAMARENGLEGTVYVSFVVMEDGSIETAKVERGLPGGGAGCDDEALRVVEKMPKWNPGKQRGKPVKVAFTLPIKFKLK